MMSKRSERVWTARLASCSAACAAAVSVRCFCPHVGELQLAETCEGKRVPRNVFTETLLAGCVIWLIAHDWCPQSCSSRALARISWNTFVARFTWASCQLWYGLTWNRKQHPTCSDFTEQSAVHINHLRALHWSSGGASAALVTCQLRFCLRLSHDLTRWSDMSFSLSRSPFSAIIPTIFINLNVNSTCNSFL